MAGRADDALEVLVRAIAHMPWFAAAGEALTRTDRDDSALYLEGLGFSGLPVVPAPSWKEARKAADHPDWDRSWWDAEERLRRALMEAATPAYGETGLLKATTAVTEAASDVVHGAAAIATARAGIADPALIKSAAGAATQCCYQAALALAAGEGAGHPFAAKLRLFESGRWPLGIVQGVFFLF